jgi:DNA repair exonuclease SbcCD ATPase subunit
MIVEKFKEHIVFERIEQLKARLHESDVREKINIEWLSFYDSVVDYIYERLKITFPTLIQETELNALSNEIQAGLNQINSFLGNTNIGHLNSANNYFNTALNRVRNFPFPIPKSKFNFSKEIAIFEKAVSDKYKLLEGKNKEINQKITKLNSLIDAKQQEIDKLNQLLIQKQNEINNLSSNFNAELNNIKTTANQQFAQEINNFKQKFNNEKQIFTKEKEELIKEFHKEKDKYIKESEESIKEISDKTAKLIKELNIKLEESKKLVNVIGNVGATGNYQKIADYHKKTSKYLEMDSFKFYGSINWTFDFGNLPYNGW